MTVQNIALKAAQEYERQREAGWPPFDDSGYCLASAIEEQLEVAKTALRLIEGPSDPNEAQEIATDALNKIGANPRRPGELE